MLHRRCAGRGTRARGARNCPLEDLKLQLQLEGQAGVSCAEWMVQTSGQQGENKDLVRKDRVHTILSEEKGTASPAARRGLVRLGQCGEEARESCQLVGQ